MLKPIILSGGSGSRLWPLSREAYPKQLLPLIGNYTLLQNTVKRLQNLELTEQPMVICNEQHQFIVKGQLHELGLRDAELVLEPMGRNTAPAVAIAAHLALAKGKDPILLVMPADHLIKDAVAFNQAVERAKALAERNFLVTFGIKPTHPETGFGYIHYGASLAEEAYQVATFIEKPALAVAQEMLAQGDYAWNSGMFVFKASVYLQELASLAPQIYQATLEVSKNMMDKDHLFKMDAQLFAACPSDSVDYAVMEKTEHAAVVTLDAGWNDVGSWDALHAASTPDENGNVSHGDVYTLNVENSYLRASERMLVAVGVKDHIIIETKDAVLVSHKDHCQDVKSVVNYLKQTGRDEHIIHKKVYRPWGSYESLIQGDRFQVKQLCVNPGARLSLQMHHHRCEHWVVVQGTAKVTRNEEEFILKENQSTYLPIGTWHRLENPGKVPLHIIEVQSGGYLGEDDILRVSDDYDRVPAKANQV